MLSSKTTSSSRPAAAEACGYKIHFLGGTAAEYIRPSLAKIYANAGYHFVFVDKDRSARGTSLICPRCAGSRRRSTPSRMWRCPSISVCRRMPSVNP